MTGAWRDACHLSRPVRARAASVVTRAAQQLTCPDSGPVLTLRHQASGPACRVAFTGNQYTKTRAFATKRSTGA
jgi:hypothetical protein